MSANIETSKIYWKDFLDKLDINKDPKKECEICRKKQIQEHGKITISCNGMPRIEDVFSEEELSRLSEDEYDFILGEIDKYDWMKKTFINKNNGKPLVSERFYQRIIVNCSANKRILRCGRRVGKSFSMALNIAEGLLSRDGYRVLLAAPYDVQAEEVYMLLKKLLENIDGIAKEEVIKSATQSPTYYIELKNGSRFRGFTTGSNDAGSVRGQGADEIYLDEVDYMNQKDFNSIMVILADSPDTKITVASTPDGEKVLYKLSQDPTFKEFHYPTHVLPHYNDELDATLRSTTDEIGYQQEVQAVYGASRNTVFQKIFIEMAFQKKIKYNAEQVMANRKRFKVSVGVDWNHFQVGTRIVVSALDKATGTIKPIHYERVSKEGWTQSAAMEKIIQLNRMYNIDYPYVDEGFGYAQVEILKSFAISQYGKLPKGHPDYNLANIVAVNSSSSVEIIDQITNAKKSKPQKQYMIEVVTNMFEDGIISLDREFDESLSKELAGFEEKSRSANGRIVYEATNKKIGDHTLDAFILSAFAFHAEESPLLNSFGLMASITQVAINSERIDQFSKIGDNISDTPVHKPQEYNSIESPIRARGSNRVFRNSERSGIKSRTRGLLEGRNGFLY